MASSSEEVAQSAPVLSTCSGLSSSRLSFVHRSPNVWTIRYVQTHSSTRDFPPKWLDRRKPKRDSSTTHSHQKRKIRKYRSPKSAPAPLSTTKAGSVAPASAHACDLDDLSLSLSRWWWWCVCEKRAVSQNEKRAILKAARRATRGGECRKRRRDATSQVREN